MSYLSSLESDLRYWEGKVSELNATLKLLKKRKLDVEEAARTLNSTSGNGSIKINYLIEVTKNDLENGIDYSERNSSISAIFANKLEQDSSGDSNLSSAASELSKELSDVNEKIIECERKLEQAKANVRSTKSAISAENRRLESERAKEAEKRAKELASSVLNAVNGKSNANGGTR